MKGEIVVMGMTLVSVSPAAIAIKMEQIAAMVSPQADRRAFATTQAVPMAKSLGVLNKFGNTLQSDVILKSMGVSAEAKAAALEVFKAIRK